MSRSRRKTPIIGFTTAVSDKPGKKQANKSFRRKTKVDVINGVENFTIHNKYITDWDMPKDGKHYCPNLDIKYMRK